MSDSSILFMSIDSVRSKDACADEATPVVLVEEGAAGDVAVVVCGGGAKKTVRVAGPLLSFVRLTVIETAGLWYLRRGRQLCQNLRAP